MAWNFFSLNNFLWSFSDSKVLVRTSLRLISSHTKPFVLFMLCKTN